MTTRAATNQKAYRERIKANKAIYKIELGPAELDGLVRSGNLDDSSADKTQKVQLAIQRHLTELGKRWE